MMNLQLEVAELGEQIESILCEIGAYAVVYFDVLCGLWKNGGADI